MKSALFIDFEDSFSFNVIQKLQEVGLSVRRINWKDFSRLSHEDILVLGPGPGHPDDYSTIFPVISDWITEGRELFGVCLGHQIFWRMNKAEIRRSLSPKHGQKIELNLNSDWQESLSLPKKIFVQRYNSLCVPETNLPKIEGLVNFVHEGEVQITKGNKILTYQFHPESEGTTYPQAFFSPLSMDLV